MSRDRIDRLYEAIRRADQAYEVWAAAHGLTLYELQIYYEMMKTRERPFGRKICARRWMPQRHRLTVWSRNACRAGIFAWM